jgi:hypothetical protein
MKLKLKPNIKLDKPLKIMRKQMALLICGGVVAAAVATSFWPTRGWFDDLAQKVDSSVSINGQLTTLLTHERHLPIVGMDPTPVDLSFYPTSDVIDKGTLAVTELGKRSAQMLDSAVALNSHEPLVDGALPAGGDFSRAQFAEKYLAAMNDDARIRDWPAPEAANLRPGFPIPPLMAGRHVTDDDITAETAAQRATADANFLSKDANGQPTPQSKQAADDSFNANVAGLGLKLEMRGAEKFKVYLEKGAIKPPAIYNTGTPNFLTATTSMAPADVWTAQLNLWVVEDVATGVAYANADSHNVLDSAVKQIVDLEVNNPPYLISGDPTAGNDSTPLTPVPDLTPTGRTCNGMYDVVQFKLSLDVDASRLAAVLDSLQRGQFITILWAQTRAVDSADRAVNRFMYGTGSVVHLDLAGEELFLHQWTAKIQPPDGGAAKYFSANGQSQQTPLFPITVHQNGS